MPRKEPTPKPPEAIKPPAPTPPPLLPRNRVPAPPESSPTRRSPAGKATGRPAKAGAPRPEPPTRQGGSGPQAPTGGGRQKSKQAPAPPPQAPKPKATGALNIETYAPELLLELINGKPDPRKLTRLAGDVKRDFAWVDKGGSWNHAQMLMAAELWDARRSSLIPAAWWTTYLRSQLGEIRADRPSSLDYFGGTEQFSNTYEGWRWGAVLAVRLWALRNRNHELLRLTARYTEVQTALLALGAAPGPTKTGIILSPNASAEVHPHTHRTGSQLWWDGPSLPMSGARSTPAHLGTDERMPLHRWYGLGRWIDDPKSRFAWPWVIAHHLRKRDDEMTGDILSDPRASLDSIRLLVPHHFLHWQHEGIRLNYMEELANGNTTSILGHVRYSNEDRAVYLFPWPGRIRSGLGPARCEIKSDRGKLRLVASSRFGEVSIDIPSREPDTHVSIGPNGVIV